MKSVKAKWAEANRDSINIIDVRTPGEYSGGHIEGSKNIPTPGIIFNSDMFLDKDKEYYLICHSGSRSLATAQQLEQKGYKVINVEGGNAALK